MLDELDQQLIQALQDNGREPNVRLAKRFGTREGTIRRRIKGLLDNRIIKIKAMPNPIRLGCTFIGIMGIEVKLTDLDDAARKLAKNHHVYYLALTTGRFDIILIFFCRGPEEVADFVRHEITPIPGIIRTETFVNMDVVKSPWTEPLDVSQLLGKPRAVD